VKEMRPSQTGIIGWRTSEEMLLQGDFLKVQAMTIDTPKHPK
jgi:hypothetical protein